MSTSKLKVKVPKQLKIELSPDKMRELAELAAKRGLRSTQLARMWILEKIEEVAASG